MLPFKILTEYPLDSRSSFKYAWVPTNSVNRIIFCTGSSLWRASIVSKSASTLTSWCWNSACFAVEIIIFSSSISAVRSRDIASIASTSPSSISRSSKSVSLIVFARVSSSRSTCRRRSKLWRTAAVLLVTMRCMIIMRKIRHMFFLRFRRALS